MFWQIARKTSLFCKSLFFLNSLCALNIFYEKNFVLSGKSVIFATKFVYLINNINYGT